MRPVLALWLALAGMAGTARAAVPDVDVDTASVEAAWRRVQLSRLDLGFATVRLRDRFSPAEVELGRALFFDASLSRDGTLSCSSCHVPALGWTDGLRRARGAGRGGARKELARNVPSLINVPYRQQLFWDGRAETVAEAALTAAANPEEMAMPPEELAARLRADPDYSARFAAVFGSTAVTPAQVGRAFEAFVRTVPRAGTSPFERFDADRSALSPLQKKGLVLFAGKARCLQCHSGPFLTDSGFHNTGLTPLPGVDDPGRAAVNGDARSRRAFATPPLRNLAVTAPYMHDGSLKTLADVVEFYARGGDVREAQDDDLVPLKLDRDEKRALVAFLESLSGPLPEEAARAAATRAPLPAAESAAAPASAPKSDEVVTAYLPGPAFPQLPVQSREDCLKDFSLPRVVAAISASTATLTGGVAEFAGRIVDYEAARAFATKDPAACDGLPARISYTGRADTLSFWCRERALDMLMLEAMVARSPSLPRVCAQSLANEYPALTAAEIADICAAVARDPADPERACDSLVGRHLYPEQRRACVFELSGYAAGAGPERCDGLNGAPRGIVEHCFDVASYARAKRTGRVEDCGRSDQCRSMFDARAADKALARVRDVACLPR